MTARAFPSRIAGVAATILIGGWGCTPSALRSPLLQPQSGTQPRTIGIVSARFEPTPNFPTTGWIRAKSLAIGAGKGLLFTVVLCGYTYGLGCFLAPILIPVGMAQEPEDAEAVYIKVNEAGLRAALADLQVQEILGGATHALTAAQTRHAFVSIPDRGPKSEGKIVSYRSLATQGVDLVLEVSVLEIGMRPLQDAPGRQGHPALGLEMTARAKLIAVPDDRLLAVHTAAYKHEPTAFVGTLDEWADNDAQVFRNEVTRASQGLAASIAVHVFGIPGPMESPPQATPVE